MMSFANFRIFKLLVEYKDTRATQRYFCQIIITGDKIHILLKNGTSAFDVKSDKNFDFGGYFGKSRKFCVKSPYI